MISGANEEELDVATDRADLLLEISRLNNIINEIDKIIRQMIYTGYYVYPKSPYEDFEGQTVTNYMATRESSEFGVRALVILDKLKALKEGKE